VSRKTRPTTRPPPLALLVENHRDTREMYAEWLVFSGYRVAEAATADEAIEKARRLHPHIIATDIGLLGNGDGCALCERLKADLRTRAIPVIAVTAWVSGGHVERSRRAGCDSVLLKPCLPEALLAEIQRLLNISPSPKAQS
jgi:two-component system, cell cycle response regulator DivK